MIVTSFDWSANILFAESLYKRFRRSLEDLSKRTWTNARKETKEEIVWSMSCSYYYCASWSRLIVTEQSMLWRKSWCTKGARIRDGSTMITQREDTLVWIVDTLDEMHVFFFFFLLFAVNFGHFVKFHFTLRSFTIINNLYYTLTMFLPSLCLSTEQYTPSILCVCVCLFVCVSNVFCVYLANISYVYTSTARWCECRARVRDTHAHAENRLRKNH